MTDERAEPKPVGPDGEELIGLLTRPIKAPRKDKRATSIYPTPPLYEHKEQYVPDPLDVAAQGGPRTRAEDMTLEEPKASVMSENQIMYCIIARVDGGEWTHTLVSDGVRPTTWESERRAEGIMFWLRRKAETDSNGVEYRVIPLMRTSRVI
jgi:hypothetical protein